MVSDPRVFSVSVPGQHLGVPSTPRKGPLTRDNGILPPPGSWYPPGTGYAASGTPLAFTQNCLVHLFIFCATGLCKRGCTHSDEFFFPFNIS